MQSSPIPRCALLVALFFLGGVHLALAQLEPGPTPPPQITPPPAPSVNPDESIPVVVHYGEGQDTRASVQRGVMAPVGLLQNQLVSVTLLLPPTRAGEPVSFGLYDGGQVGLATSVSVDGAISVMNPGSLWVSETGSVRFNFKAGRILGLYRLLVGVGPSQYLLQFYAVPRATDGGLPFTPPTIRPPPSPPPTPGPQVTPTPN